MTLHQSLVWVLFAVPLVAGFGEASEAPGPASLNLSLSATHDAQIAAPVGAESWATGFSGAMKQPQIENDVQLEADQGPVKAVFSTEIVNSATGTTVQFQENYVAWSPDNFRLAVGYQIFAWGTADGANPTDNLNPRDYTSVSGQKIRKLPVLAGAATWYPTETVSVEAVFVPETGTSKFPSDPVAGLVAQGLTASAQGPDGSPGQAVAGGRVNYRSSAFDASISYLYDLDAYDTPEVASNFDVTLVRKRVHRLGADFKTTLGGLGFWAEGCYTLTGNTDSGNWTERLSQWQHTVGMDFSFGPEDAGYADIQYNATWVPGYDASADTYAQSDVRFLEKSLLYSIEGVDSEWLHTLLVNTHYSFASDTLVPSLSLSYSLPVHYDDSTEVHYGSLLVKPEVEIVPVDAFHVTFGAVLAWSWVKVGQAGITLDTSDSVGVYTPQNNVFLAVKYQWNTTNSK